MKLHRFKSSHLRTSPLDELRAAVDVEGGTGDGCVYQGCAANCDEIRRASLRWLRIV
jgi:hypothetical protein